MRFAWLPSFLVAIITFAVWMLTASPGLTYTDSGELTAAAAVWGVAHPTGYPLFTLLGNTWLRLPWSEPIAGLTVLCALFVSLAVALFVPLATNLLTRLGGDYRRNSFIASAAALALAFSGIVWQQATGVEVYGLHLFLLVATLFALERASVPENSVRYIVIAGFTAGLALANHLSYVFLVPGLLWLWFAASHNRKRDVLLLVVPAVLGLLLYVLLPLRSAAEPAVNWGAVDRSLEAFLYHVRGTQFGVWLFSDAEAASRNTGIAVRAFGAMVAWVGLVPVVFGVWTLLRQHLHVGIGLILIAVGNIAISIGYSIPDIDSYFIPSLVVLALFFAVGMGSLAMNRRLAVLVPLAFAVPLIGLVSEWKEQDRSTFNGVEEYTSWLLANAEKDAVILSHQWDYAVSALWYMQTVKAIRTDVAIVDKELLRRTWYAPHLQRTLPEVMKGLQPAVDAYMEKLIGFERDADKFMKRRSDVVAIQQRFVDLLNGILENNSHRPLYVTPEMLSGEQGFAEGYGRIPCGPLVRLIPPGQTTMRLPLRLDSVRNLVGSLAGRTQRLDEGLRRTVVGGLTETAAYRVRVDADTVGFREMYNLVSALDPRSRAVHYLGSLQP